MPCFGAQSTTSPDFTRPRKFPAYVNHSTRRLLSEALLQICLLRLPVGAPLSDVRALQEVQTQLAAWAREVNLVERARYCWENPEAKLSGREHNLWEKAELETLKKLHKDADVVFARLIERYKPPAEPGALIGEWSILSAQQQLDVRFAEAIEHGDTAMAATLIREHGVSPSGRDLSGETFFESAVCNDAVEIVRLLLEDGLDVNTPNFSGQRLLDVALDYELSPAMRELLRGAEKAFAISPLSSASDSE